MGGSLTKGVTKSCGCLRTDSNQKRAIDLVGQKFGRLTVLEKLPERKNEHIVWKCQCDCGNIVNVSGYCLKSGNTNSCGCYKSDRIRETNTVDMTGQRFGKLVVIERDFSKGNNKKAYWKCLCDCGNYYSALGPDLRNGHTNSCGCLISKGEAKIRQLLQQANYNFTIQQSFNTCLFDINNARSKARFDFCVNDQYLIEYDGQQHFKCTGQGWDTEEEFEKRKVRDAYKNQWCKDNHIPLIRIPYTHYDDLCIEDLMLETTKFRVEGT